MTLNIFMPGEILKKKKKLFYLYYNFQCAFIANQPRVPMPVLIGIHGGSYASGSGSDLGPDFLLNQDNIIFVSLYKVIFS